MSDTVRFLHTADLHLDSPLRSLAARDAALGTLIQDASRTVLRSIVDLALEEQVDALIIAGDLFDGDQRDVSTAMVLQREFRRLNDACVPVFIIWGNHDAEARLLGIIDFPDNVHAFSDKGETHYFADEQAAVHGVSFSKRSTPKSLLDKYPAPVSDCFNIGMLHTSLTGSDGHNNYAPCTVEQLINMGYDYWALGHIHTRQVHHEDPAIVMPGNPLGRHINEAGRRTVSIVTLAPRKAPAMSEHELAPVRFERIFVPIDGIESRHLAVDQIIQTIKLQRDALDTPHLIARVHLQGATELRSVYQRNSPALLAQLQTEFEHRDDLWIDSIDARALTSPIFEDSDKRILQNSTLNELMALLDNDLLATANLKDNVIDDLKKLTRALPGELNQLFDIESTDNLSDWIQTSALWMKQQLETDEPSDSSPRNSS